MTTQQKTLWQELTKGLWSENPVLITLLGCCPTLAVTNSAINGISMGIAVMFTLVCSSALISMVRKHVPNEVRIATFIIVIATFVTMADLVMSAYFPPISKALGPFVPLIVVNCIVLGRQEAFASKNTVLRSIIDAIGMSLGFMITLAILGILRELLGSGSVFSITVMPSWFTPWMVMILPPGAFFTLGCMMALMNCYNKK